MKKKKIYIAGKVTNENRNACILKFEAAEKQLRAKGYTVVNPLKVINDWHMPWNEAVDIGLKALEKCDAIYLLADWYHSRGAIIEHAKAIIDEKEILHQMKLIKWKTKTT